MDVLTRERAKPTLPFGGSYQLVDIPLSNLVNSGISDVWLSVQYQAGSLHRHLASGRPWDLDRTRGGLRWLMPEEGGASSAQDGFSASAHAESGVSVPYLPPEPPAGTAFTGSLPASEHAIGIEPMTSSLPRMCSTD